MGAILLSLNSDSLANRMPFVKDVYKEIRNSKKSEVMSINFNEYFEDSAQEVNQTVTANGKTVTAEKTECLHGNIKRPGIKIWCRKKVEKCIISYRMMQSCY